MSGKTIITISKSREMMANYKSVGSKSASWTKVMYFAQISVLKKALFAANFFCTQLYFLPLVVLKYFRFINERIAQP